MLKDRNLLCLCCRMLHEYHDVMPREDLVVAAKALALLCEAEDFQTDTVGCPAHRPFHTLIGHGCSGCGAMEVGLSYKLESKRTANLGSRGYLLRSYLHFRF